MKDSSDRIEGKEAQDRFNRILDAALTPKPSAIKKAEEPSSWHKITRSDWVVMSLFETLWLRAGGPKNAALFGVRNFKEKTTTFYFTPKASGIAAEILTQYEATPCPPLDYSNLSIAGPVLLVGDQSIIEGND